MTVFMQENAKRTSNRALILVWQLRRIHPSPNQRYKQGLLRSLDKLSYKQRPAYKRKRSVQRTENHDARAQKKRIYISLFRKKKDTQLKLSA